MKRTVTQPSRTTIPPGTDATLPREPATIVCLALLLAVVALAVRIASAW